MSIDDLWYKNAIIYCLDVEKYQDANGDGIGDFEGLMRRLDYLAGLGATCVWLQPFYASPNRDNGYDVSDYYAVHERHGSLGDFVNFMNHADALGMRVIVDLVVNHTSIDSPWFQSARSKAKSVYRDWYVWADQRPKDHKTGIVFPGQQTTTWSLDRKAGKYYFHRFYAHQADLNTWNPYVRAEIHKIMGFWLQLGVSGFRMDAVPFLIEKKGAGIEHEQDFTLLKEMRDFLQWRSGNAILLAEANVPPDESMQYFGAEGERLQMMLNFPVNQRLFYALATGDIEPLIWALEQTWKRPRNAQWVQFLRSHDELDLGRPTDEQRDKVFAAFGPKKTMQLYDRGIRRRLTPMLGGDRRRLELAYSLMCTLPGTPVIRYGDEIGMGDDLALPERNCARTPMQWSNEPHAGFTKGEKPCLPVIDEGPYGFEHVNVAKQRRDPNSMLNWTERIIRMRKEVPEIGWGDFNVIATRDPAVLIIRYDWRNNSVLFVHNLDEKPREVSFAVGLSGEFGKVLINLLAEDHSHANEQGKHMLLLEPYGYRWYRVGGLDYLLKRSDIDVEANRKRQGKGKSKVSGKRNPAHPA